MWIILAVFFFLFGFAVHKLKWYFLISGYNTMSKKKKANVNVTALGKLFGMYFYGVASLFLIMAGLQVFEVNVTTTPIWILFAVATVSLLIRAQKYDGNLFDEHGKLRKGAGKQLILPISIVVLVVIGVGILLLFSSKSAEIAVTSKGVEIEGMYGDVYDWDDLSEVQVISELPTITLRSNGSAIGSHLKGYFQTKELGNVKLFVDTDISLFIRLKSKEGIVIFNMENEERTRELYEEIKRKYKENRTD